MAGVTVPCLLFFEHEGKAKRHAEMLVLMLLSP